MNRLLYLPIWVSVLIFAPSCSTLTPLIPYVTAAKDILETEIAEKEATLVDKDPKSPIACRLLPVADKVYLRQTYIQKCICKKRADFLHKEKKFPFCNPLP